MNQKENEKQKFNQELSDKSKLVEDKSIEIRNLSSEQEQLKTAIEDLINQSKSLKDSEIPQFQKKLSSKQWDAFQISEKLTVLQKEMLKIIGEKEDIQSTVDNLDADIRDFQDSIQAMSVQKEKAIQKFSIDKRQELEEKSKLAQVKVVEFNKSASQKNELLYQLESLRKAQKLQNEEQQVANRMLKDIELEYNKIAATLDGLQKEIPQITAEAVEIDSNMNKWADDKFDPEIKRLKAAVKEAKGTRDQMQADLPEADKEFDTQTVQKHAKLQQLIDEVAKINKAMKKAQNQGEKITKSTKNKYKKRIAKLKDQYEAI
jgi:chromosome segregation ATPase